jgi:hypothetical protein
MPETIEKLKHAWPANRKESCEKLKHDNSEVWVTMEMTL